MYARGYENFENELSTVDKMKFQEGSLKIKNTPLKTVWGGKGALKEYFSYALPFPLWQHDDKMAGIQIFILDCLIPILSGVAGYVFFNKNPFIIALFFLTVFRCIPAAFFYPLRLNLSRLFPGTLIIGGQPVRTKDGNPHKQTFYARYKLRTKGPDGAFTPDTPAEERSKIEYVFDREVYTARDFGKNRTQQLNEFRNFALSLSADSRTDRLIKSDRFFEDFVDVINSCYDADEERQTIDDILPILKDNPETLKTLINCYFVIKLG